MNVLSFQPSYNKQASLPLKHQGLEKFGVVSVQEDQETGDRLLQTALESGDYPKFNALMRSYYLDYDERLGKEEKQKVRQQLQQTLNPNPEIATQAKQRLRVILAETPQLKHLLKKR